LTDRTRISRSMSVPVTLTRWPTYDVSLSRFDASTTSTAAGFFFRNPDFQLRDRGASSPAVSFRRKISSFRSRQPVSVTGQVPGVGGSAAAASVAAALAAGAGAGAVAGRLAGGAAWAALDSTFVATGRSSDATDAISTTAKNATTPATIIVSRRILRMLRTTRAYAF